MEEKRITLWNNETLSWNAKEYIAANSVYKKLREEHEFYIWETVLYVAEELGLAIHDVEFLVKENKELEIADLFFCMFLIRIYGRGFAEQYIGSEKKKTIQNIHQFMREAAGFIIDQKSDDGEDASVPDESIVKEVEKIMTEIAQNNSKMQKQFDSYLGQIKQGLEAFAEKAKKEEAPAKTEGKSKDEIKQIQKLEVENQVLKFQLAHKDEMAKLQLQLQINAKDAGLKQSEEKVEELQKQCEMLQKRCEELEKKDEQRSGELQSLFSAYQVVVEANTKQFERLVPLNIFRWKK